MVALACMMRTPVDPQSEIRGTIYGMDGIAPRFLRERRSWEDRVPAEKYIWKHPIELLDDVCHIESHFSLFGDSVSFGPR